MERTITSLLPCDEETAVTNRHDTDDDLMVRRIADRHGFTPQAVRLMHTAVSQGHGSMAQFDHPEFGGLGQWMRGGMVMLPATHDDGLRSRVNALCVELADLETRPTSERDKDAAEGREPVPAAPLQGS